MKGFTSSQLKRIIIRGIKANADRIFDISQKRVPVDKGFLKHSGHVTKEKDGATISYRAPYSATVEFGSRAYKIVGDQLVQVKAPGAYTKSGKRTKKKLKIDRGFKVTGYIRVYHNKRLIPIRDKSTGKTEFRLISEVPERKGTFFLTKSVKEGIKELPNDIARSFAQEKGVTKVER